MNRSDIEQVKALAVQSKGGVMQMDARVVASLCEAALDVDTCRHRLQVIDAGIVPVRGGPGLWWARPVNVADSRASVRLNRALSALTMSRTPGEALDDAFKALVEARVLSEAGG